MPTVGIQVALRRAALAVACAVGIGACVAGGGSSSSPNPSVAPGTTLATASLAPSASAMTSPSGPIAEARIAAARADVAKRYGFDPAAIVVEKAEAVTWPNAGLGCPAYERSYDPTPVPGYRIVLRAGDRHFTYHGAADDDSPFLCEFLD
jgi:hypothetical protein